MIRGDRPAQKEQKIEITPQMIEAGVLAAREHSLGEDLVSLVRKVYLAMLLESF